MKDVRVLHYERRGPEVELMVEQVTKDVHCPRCGQAAWVKERPVVRYVDLPVYGTPMRLAWRKHRTTCVGPLCPMRSFVLQDHRIAAKNCLLTTRAAKWATVQVGTGRTVSEVAGELACDWHVVNDAVTTYGKALLAAGTKRLNKTSATGLDETNFVRLGRYRRTQFVTTVADVEHHQVIDLLPSRDYREAARWSRNGRKPGRNAPASAPSTSRPPTRRCTRSSCRRSSRWPTPFMPSARECLPRRRPPPGAGRRDRAPGAA